MNIYDESGDLDTTKAGEELRATPLISNERIRRDRVAEITAAALLDIASSLRTVSLEAGSAMGLVDLPAAVEFNDDGIEADRDFLIIGDLVHVDSTTRVGTVAELGFDDGELVARVTFASGSPDMTYYASNLTRLVGNERPRTSTDAEDAEMIDADEAPDLFADVGDPAAVDLVDDIDADFDGAEHPAAENAVDVLRANEEKRKAAKKTGTKKGKKS